MELYPILSFLASMFHPDAEFYMDPVDLMRTQGYGNVETHIVESHDGYRLLMWRLRAPAGSNKEPILLHHGIMQCGADWLILEDNKNLPYKLVDAGFEVWILNGRGATYTKEQNHVMTEDPMNPVWNFSAPHIAMNDIPAVINYILARQEPDKKQLYTVGYSIGSKLLYLAVKLKPGLCKKIKGMVHIAPGIYIATHSQKWTPKQMRKHSVFPLWMLNHEGYHRSAIDIQTWMRNLGRVSPSSLGGWSDIIPFYASDSKVNGTSKFIFAPPPSPTFPELFLYGTADMIATPEHVERAIADLGAGGHTVLGCRVHMLDHYGMMHSKQADRLVFEPILTFLTENYVRNSSQRTCSFKWGEKYKHSKQRNKFN